VKHRIFKQLRSESIHSHRPLIIAHRGASGHAPENTMAAFRLAVAQDVDGVEFDVHLTADRVPVVIHDRRVDRTTTGRGAVAQLTLKEIRQLDAGSWFDRKLKIANRMRAVKPSSHSAGIDVIPTLIEVLNFLKPAKLSRVYVELKGNRGEREVLLDQVLDALAATGLQEAVTLLSFDHSIVSRARELNERIRTAATFPGRGRRLISARALINSAVRAGADEVALHQGLATRRMVDSLHDKGFAVSAWTANSKLAMRRLLASGVDSIMTNFPERLGEVLNGSDLAL